MAGGVGGRFVWVFTVTLLAFLSFYFWLYEFSVLFSPVFFFLLNSSLSLIIVFYTPLSLRHKKSVYL